MPLPKLLRRLGATAVFALALSTSAHAFTERAVTLPTTPGALHGTLTLPDGEARGPGVLMLAGSGPVDRDGNLPGMATNAHRMLAQALAELGIASLRVDKRAIAASAEAAVGEESLRFTTYVDDAIAWAAMLAAEPRVASVAVLGHSEGALVGTMVARRIPVARLVLLAGAAEPAGTVIEAQIAAAGAPPQAIERTHAIVQALIHGTPLPEIPPPLAPLFRPSIQPYMASWLAIDPAAELRGVTVPVLIVNGTTDLQVPPAQAQMLHAALPASRLVLIEGMNHVLKVAPVERQANFMTYTNPILPLAPGLVDAIAGFLKP